LAQLKAVSTVPRHRYDVYSVAVQAACTVLFSLRSVPAPFKDLADQCSRAVTSVGLNTAEGLGRAGRDQGQHLRIAYGSALEATAALQMLSAVGAASPEAVDGALALLDRTRAMLWRLMHAAG
jgi:four helix bundle protein